MDELYQMFDDISANIKVLGMAGVSGAVVRAVVAPEQHWKRRLAQGIAGAVSAIFIGPLVAHLLSGFVDKEVYAWLAAGFVCGYAGETTVSLIQRKISGGGK